MAVLFCHCAYSQIIPESVKRQLEKGLVEKDIKVAVVPDLCGLVAGRDTLIHQLNEAPDLQIIACYPRTIRWLFESAGLKLPPQTTIYNMRTESAESILGQIQSESATTIPKPDTRIDASTIANNGWEPWFPVIDYDRCIDCKQCLNFCLFGVFAPAEQGKVIVKNPQNCKTNCPACARVCPEVAIIFPKFPDAPINGAEVRDEDIEGQKSGVQLTDTLKGDIYDKLRQRSKTAGGRFAVVKDPDLAAQERCKCARLAKLQQDLNIPDEVIQSLRGAEPSSQEPAVGCDCDCSTDSDCDCDCSDPTEPRGEGCCCD